MSIALFVCEVSINIRGNEKAINKSEMRLMDEIVGGTIGYKQWRDVKKITRVVEGEEFRNLGRRGERKRDADYFGFVSKYLVSTWRYFRASPEPRCLPVIITQRQYLRDRVSA